MIGDEALHPVTKAMGFQSFRNFVPKDAFTHYCWLTTDSLVIRDHGPPAGGSASLHATRWTLWDALVASEGRLGP
jgi:hypothetical protein